MNTPSTHIPNSEQEALQWLLPALDQAMGSLPAEAFKKAWSAVFFLYGGLHPDGALEHGTELITVYDGPEEYRSIDPRLVVPRHAESGWPVVLTPMAKEAWRRHGQALLSDDELYCADAQHAGFLDRMTN